MSGKVCACGHKAAAHRTDGACSALTGKRRMMLLPCGVMAGFRAVCECIEFAPRQAKGVANV